MTPTYSSSRSLNVLSRSTLLEVLRVAAEINSFRFARQAALAWLAVYPGDLGIQLLYACSMIAESKPEQGIQALVKIVRFDPEFLEAQRALAEALKGIDEVRYENALSDVFALGGDVEAGYQAPDWAAAMRKAIPLLNSGKNEEASTLIHPHLGAKDDPVLVAIQHARVTRTEQDPMTTFRLANLYHTRWPDCLQFTLIMAEAQMTLGEDTNGVNLIHWCASNDAAGQVPARLWGASHPYRPLWQEGMEIPLDLPIPADVAAKLGWNKLGAGGETITTRQDTTVEDVLSTIEAAGNAEAQKAVEEPSAPAMVEAPDVPIEAQEAAKPNAEVHSVDPKSGQRRRKEHLREVEVELEQLAQKLNRPGLGRADGRFPVFVIFSTAKGLKKQYGEGTAEAIDRELHKYADAVKRMSGWGALVYYPDDTQSTGAFGLTSVDTIDPWKLKLSLVDLDNALARKGQMIGALLIIGGPEVVPFHRLPNPTDDLDEEVLSDNPYATLDANYFVPEWPTGRMPGEKGPDAGLLLEQIRQGISFYQAAKPNGFIEWIRSFFQSLKKNPKRALTGNGRNFNYGMTAAIWRRSSSAAYRPVGAETGLEVCPPTVSGALNLDKISGANLSYYNLHGVSDAPEWYGQRDPQENQGGPDFPVALTRNDLVKNGRTPQVVFSEACYGAYIEDKSEEESIALGFLSLGAHVMIGSTCIAYGSINPPLIGGDLLGNLFWKYLRDGYRAGEAFLQAKVELAREMNKRQGYIDGEDQKTLISFIYLGDPLYTPQKNAAKAKAKVRVRAGAEIKAVCDRAEEESAPAVSGDVIVQVKQYLNDYLPGLDHADITVSTLHVNCNGKDHVCPSAELGAKVRAKSHPDHVIITISKQVQMQQHRHMQYARVTLDKEGKMIKLAVSR